MSVPVLDATSILLLGTGLAFFIAGTAGVLRFGSTLNRVHAVTKADTLGLGFIVAGLAIRADSVRTVGLLVGIWAVALAASAASSQLIAREAYGDAAPAGTDRERTDRRDRDPGDGHRSEPGRG